MFENIENKERFFIQPYIDGKKCEIRISKNKNSVSEIRCFDKDKKKIKLIPRYKKIIKNSYETSKYNGFNIYLKGLFVTDEKNKESLVLYDILLENEYEKKIQSRKYSLRYENLILRFLNTKINSDVRPIFSYPFSDTNLSVIIEQFVKTNKLDKIVFRKDEPYEFDNEEIIVENICEKRIGTIINYKEGTVIQREFNDKQEIVSEAEVAAVDSFEIEDDETHEIFLLKLEKNLDSEKISMLSSINKIIKEKCYYKIYKILDKKGFIFSGFLN